MLQQTLITGGQFPRGLAGSNLLCPRSSPQFRQSRQWPHHGSLTSPKQMSPVARTCCWLTKTLSWSTSQFLATIYKEDLTKTGAFVPRVFGEILGQGGIAPSTLKLPNSPHRLSTCSLSVPSHSCFSTWLRVQDNRCRAMTSRHSFQSNVDWGHPHTTSYLRQSNVFSLSWTSGLKHLHLIRKHVDLQLY